MIQPCVSSGTQGKTAQTPCLPECIKKFVTVNFQVHGAIYGPIFPPKTSTISFCSFHDVFLCWKYFFEKFPKINQTELAPTRAPISSQGPTPVPREPNPEDGFQGPTFAAFELKTKPSEPPRWDSGMVGGLTPQEGAPRPVIR